VVECGIRYTSLWCALGHFGYNINTLYTVLLFYRYVEGFTGKGMRLPIEVLLPAIHCIETETVLVLVLVHVCLTGSIYYVN
jgi:hypothetical protein